MPEEEPHLLQTEKGPTLEWRGLFLYPPGDPIEYARRKARVFSPLPRSLVYVPSLGLGHGLAELLARLPDDCGILCVEAFQEIMAISLTRELPRDPRLLIIRTADPAAAAAALRELGVGKYRRVVEIPLCAGYRLAPEIYAKLRRALEAEISRYWHNRLTLIAMGSLQVRNLFSNLPRLGEAADFSSLSSTYPAVVCGAGPSLEASLPLLRELRGHFVLIAADTALPTLMDADCPPDVVLALEAQTANVQDFLRGTGRDTCLACDISSHPIPPRLFSGRLYFFSSRFAPLSLFDRMESHGLLPTQFPALGSVGVAAVHAALRLTSGPVLLTGLDFSFPGLRIHTRGSPSHLAMLWHAGRFRPVGLDAYRALAARSLVAMADKNGGVVVTDRVLASYRDVLKDEVETEPARVADMGGQGLPLGARLLSREEARALLLSAPQSAHRLTRAADPGRRVPDIRAFLAEERALLLRAGEATRGQSMAPTELREMLRAVEHAWVHFPDEPDLDAPDAGFLARVRVATAYYAQRIERMESVL
jgi:hypothetical protein